MTKADIIILIIVLIMVGLIIARIIVKRVKKEYCYDCSSKAGCQMKIEELFKNIKKDLNNKKGLK